MNEYTTPRRADFWPLPLHSVGLVLPLLLIAAGPAFDPTFGSADPAAYLADVRTSATAYLLSGSLVLAGMLLLPLTAAALVRLAVTARRRLLLRVGALALGAWGVLGVAGVSTGYTAGWVAAHLPGASSTMAEHVLAGVTYGPWGLAGGGLGAVAYFAGVILTGLALMLSRSTPVWTGWVVLLSPLGTLLANALGLPLLAAVGMTAAAGALAGCIPTLLRSPALVVASRQASSQEEVSPARAPRGR